MGGGGWKAIVCAGSEERSVGLTRWAMGKGLRMDAVLLRVDDAPSRYQAEVERLSDLHEVEIRRGLRVCKYGREKILAEMSAWSRLIEDQLDEGRIILDISAMPKRVFLFLLKILLGHRLAQDVIVTYCKPSSYPEGALSEAASAPFAIPGFARESDASDDITLIVGVGFAAFNLEELLEQKQGKVLKFLMPFPPASPSFRRNWALLKRLNPPGHHAEVKRIHGMDAFEAARWIRSVGAEGNGSVEMIPLGPKPHALAMALAYRKIGPNCQITYAQPTVYRHDYSLGIAETEKGGPDILAYCLRKGGREIFV